MKKKRMVLLLFILCLGLLSQAQVPVIGTLLGKVVKAFDLKVQRMQNETLWLQRAQAMAEHELSRFKLAEIAAWQQKQQEVYGRYFNELKLVKKSITDLSQVKRIINMQADVSAAYHRLAKDAAVAPQYDALLSGSVEIVQTLAIVLRDSVSMKDGDRILLIQTLQDAMHQCLKNIRLLN